MTGAGLPRWAWLPFALAMALLVIPLAGLLARAPWARLGELLASDRSRDALLLSLATCAASTARWPVSGSPRPTTHRSTTASAPSSTVR